MARGSIIGDRNTWHELGDRLYSTAPYREVLEERDRPTRDEIRQRFVAALNEIAEGDDAALAEFLRETAQNIILIDPPHRQQNMAPFGCGRIPGTIKRTITRQKLDKERSGPNVMVFEFDEAGNAIMETVELTEPSGTFHILDEEGHGICGIKSALVRGGKGEDGRAVCSPCQRERDKRPWPLTVWPWEDPAGGAERRVVFFAEERERRRAEG